MNELTKLIEDVVYNQTIIEIILSNLRNKNSENYTKISIKPVIIKDNIFYQFSFYYSKKVIHENLDKIPTIDRIKYLLINEFKQAVVFTDEVDIQILISKKLKITVLKNKPTKQSSNLEHNKIKNYIIKEGTPIDFLIELGIMNSDGKVLSKKYNKFKQINRFLEMIKDIEPYLENNKVINIIDFGCGKSYLTFITYYYFSTIKGFDINIIGLDLKKDVIDNCNNLVKKLGWKNLNFVVGSIENFENISYVDMVITLHACDIATDAAIEKAIKWNTKVILSVPCCQHELNNQIKNDILEPMLKYGILKERFASLATDAIRANLLEINGYKVQILEFIDMEHTPKNILIRAIKDNVKNMDYKLKKYNEFKDFLGVNPCLENYISKKKQ